MASLSKFLRSCYAGPRVRRAGASFAAVLLALFLKSNPDLQAQTSVLPGSSAAWDAETAGELIDTQDLTFVQDAAAGTLEAAIEASPGTTWTLKLKRHTTRGDRFRVLVAGAAQELTEVGAPGVTTLRGQVEELPEGRVFAHFDSHGLTATVHTADGVWCVQPTPETNLLTGSTSHYVIPPEVALAVGLSCGGAAQGVQSLSVVGGPFAGDVAVCELSIDADYEFYEASGSSVEAAVHDIEALINAVEPLYAVDGIKIAYEIATIVVRVVPEDPYEAIDAISLLAEVEETWDAAPFDAFPADLVHLFTGKDLNGGTIGIATLGGVCGDGAKAGLSQPNYTSVFAASVALVAHEIGHGWNALHCDDDLQCQVMCSVITGCTGIYDSFSAGEAQAISDYRATRTCLTELPQPHPLPFFEEFAETELDPDRWLFVHGALVSGDAAGAPSEPFALNLDAAGSAELEDDEIRSNRILLGGAESVVLSFHTRHVGVEASEELLIEFQDSSFEWQELERIISDGVDQDMFGSLAMLLPDNAIHDAFRIRFRAAVDESDDDWYVDDLRLEALVPIEPELESVSPPAGPLIGGGEVTIRGRNFQPDATVLFAGIPLTDVVRISEQELHGTVPGHDVSEAVMVEILQLAGELRVPDAYLYADNALVVESIAGVPGSDYWMAVTATHAEDLQAFALGIDYEAADVTVLDATTLGTDSEGADFVAPIIDNNPGTDGGWWTIGVVVDLIPPLEDAIPAGTGNVLVNFQVRINEDAVGGATIPVTPRSGLGTVPVHIWFISASEAIEPEIVAGVIEVLDDTASFVRGDCNRDGGVSLADAIVALQFLFSEGSVTCLDAVDTNDDGVLSISDPIFFLGFLFGGGAEPPSPYPNSGEDPTEDELGCTVI